MDLTKCGELPSIKRHLPLWVQSSKRVAPRASFQGCSNVRWSTRIDPFGMPPSLEAFRPGPLPLPVQVQEAN